MPFTRLTDRRVIRVHGAEARSFLDRLVTCDLDRLSPDAARFGALLTPQGKIIADFFAVDANAVDADTIYLDVPTSCADELVKRLSVYRLRAKLVIENVGDDLTVLAGWGDMAPPTGGQHLVVPDPRLAELGWRAILGGGGLMKAGAPDDGEAAYLAHRVELGVPESGADFTLNDAFPHEALLDQLGGVDFDKGCYVGQEVVSRMQHRGTARTRIVSLLYGGGRAVDPGLEVTAGERSIGRTGSGSGDRGFATIRLDRASDALAAGETIHAGGRPVSFAKPSFVRFAYPGETGAAAI